MSDHTSDTPPPRTLRDPLAVAAYRAGFRAVAAARAIPCRWRADGLCQTPIKCHYGYECEARPTVADARPESDAEAPWRALPDDLPLMAALRWLTANGIAVAYHPGAAGDIHLTARIGDDGYAALLRDVRPAPTGVGR